MNESFFSNIPFGKVYICYNPVEAMPSAADVDCVLGHIKSQLSNYVVDFLATDADTAGMLVARRFNLGVVNGGYGVLVSPAYPGVSLYKRAGALVKGLLDVDSFRNEPVLYLDKMSMFEDDVYLDACGTTLENVSSTHLKQPFRAFWRLLRNDASDAVEDYGFDALSQKIDCAQNQCYYKECKADSHPSLGSGLGYIVKGITDLVSHSKSVEYDMEEECTEKMCAEAAEATPSYGDPTDEILSEKEALARQIASLVRLYILKYGEVDDEKIACMLQGKMVLRSDKLSNLVVNRDCKIVLPDYDETELNLGGPLHVSLYILFLRHAEGIAVKDVANFIDELEGIYTMVAPNFNTDPVYGLKDPKRVTQSISKINKIIKSVLPVGDLSDKYTIQGGRNKPYSIALSSLEGRVNIMPKF